MLRLLALLLLTLLTGLVADDEPAEVVEHHPSGEVSRRYQVDEAGQPHGTWLEFDAEGHTLLHTEYQDGLEHGKRLEYAADGTVLRKAKLARGKLTGTDIRYYSGGERHTVARWKAGQLHGEYERFREDGSRELRTKYRQGQLHGTHIEYHASGTKTLVADYREGLLSGDHVTTSPDETRVVRSSYDAGLLNGDRELVVDRRTVTKQTWDMGTIVLLDGLAVYPRPGPELVDELASILGAAALGPDAPERAQPDRDDQEERAAALARLQAYRALCGLPWREVVVDDERSDRCRDAARVCDGIGRLDHHPPRPEGLSDDVYEAGYDAAGKSNLHVGYDLVGAVDGYMDDSDPSNIDRVGHRRWCLDPKLERTGFGRWKRYSAMWANDRSGPGLDEPRAVMYPPPGLVPAQLFGPGHAWSISLPTGTPVRAGATFRAGLTPLGPDFLASGPERSTDYQNLETGGFGSGACLIFRFGTLDLTDGAAYRCRIWLEGQDEPTYDYVVCFADDARLASRARRP